MSTFKRVMLVIEAQGAGVNIVDVDIAKGINCVVSARQVQRYAVRILDPGNLKVIRLSGAFISANRSAMVRKFIESFQGVRIDLVYFYASSCNGCLWKSSLLHEFHRARPVGQIFDESTHSYIVERIEKTSEHIQLFNPHASAEEICDIIRGYISIETFRISIDDHLLGENMPRKNNNDIRAILGALCHHPIRRLVITIHGLDTAVLVGDLADAFRRCKTITKYYVKNDYEEIVSNKLNEIIGLNRGLYDCRKKERVYRWPSDATVFTLA